jgi:RNA polymerase sigma-70 factor (ECF subfamily)
MHENTEIYCLEKILTGDTRAFSWLVDKYKDMVYTLCIRMLGSEVEAEEAAQDVFIKVFRSLKNYQGRSKFSTWIYRITYNHCISILRKKVKMIDLVDEIHEDQVDVKALDALQDLKAEERSRYLQKALAELPETDALVITLYYYEDQSLEEIMEITGLTSSNVRVRLHRARLKIYAELSRQLKTELKSIL